MRLLTGESGAYSVKLSCLGEGKANVFRAIWVFQQLMIRRPRNVLHYLSKFIKMQPGVVTTIQSVISNS